MKTRQLTSIEAILYYICGGVWWGKSEWLAYFMLAFGIVMSILSIIEHIYDNLSISDFGAVWVEAVDDKGNTVRVGYLLQLTLSGKLRRTRYVNPNLGFELDYEERIKLEE